MKSLRVVYDRWDDGWWVSRIPGVPGVHSNGRTIEEARRRVREALAVARDEGWNAKRAASVELVDEIHLSAQARKAIDEREAALAALQAAAATVERTTEKAIRALLGGMGLGRRDVAAFLKLSHQRVQQLAASGTYDAERSERASIARESEVPYRADRRSAAKRARRKIGGARSRRTCPLLGSADPGYFYGRSNRMPTSRRARKNLRHYE